MDEDWDLLAVVRSCIHTAATNPTDIDTAAGEAFPLLTLPDLGGDRNPVQSPDPVMGLPRNHDPSQELQEVWKPYVSPPEPVQTSQTAVVSHINPNPHFSGFRGLVEGLQLQQKQHQPPQLELGPTHFQNATTNTTTTLSFHTNQYSPQPKPRPKRSSNQQQKRVVSEVAAESLSTDLWSWRKYGQKPIKGSPHPRNYYRCSSSKGCAARKQVERSSTDPKTFLVTYTGDHSHPRLTTHCNSFTRIARSKFFAADSPISTPSPTTLLTGSTENKTEDPTAADAARKTNVEENVKAMAEINSGGIERYIDDKDSNFGGGILSPNMAISEDILMGWQE